MADNNYAAAAVSESPINTNTAVPPASAAPPAHASGQASPSIPGAFTVPSGHSQEWFGRDEGEEERRQEAQGSHRSAWHGSTGHRKEDRQWDPSGE